MKRLILLRHAKSTWDDPVARDFDRPLNGKGKRAARAIGRHMRQEGIAFDRAIASPALRVTETVSEVAIGYGRRIGPDWDKRIYLAQADTLLDIIRETPAEIDRLLLVGHNPGMEELVLTLVPDREEDETRDRVEEKYPTASMAEIAFDVPDWADVAANAGTLTRFVRPRDLDPELGPGRD
jgi:phosphohistidine phosphatase